MCRLHIRGLAVSMAVLFTSVIACAPPAVPTTPLVATPAQTSAAPSPVVTSAPSPADAAWQQVEQAGRREGRLVVYDTIYFAGDRGEVVKQAFKEKYGISLEVLSLGGSATIIEKLRVEKSVGQLIADVVDSGGTSGRDLMAADLVQKGVDKELPVLRDKQAFTLEPVFSPDGGEFTFTYTVLTPAVNSKLVRPGEISSFKDFLDPKWKGKIIMRDPRMGSGTTMIFAVVMRHENVLDDQYFVSLGKQTPMLSGMGETEIVQMVARGEYPVAYISNVDSSSVPLMREGAPLSVLSLKEGAVAQNGLIETTKGGPHPNAAKLFVNWILSTEGQTLWNKAQGTRSVRKDVPDFTPSNIKIDPFTKLYPTSWDVSGIAAQEVKNGVMETFFGKR